MKNSGNSISATLIRHTSDIGVTGVVDKMPINTQRTRNDTHRNGDAYPATENGDLVIIPHADE